MSFFKSPNTPFYLITISVLIILIVPVLIQDGMFMDGMQFSCVSMNLSKGLGSFWFPYYSQTWYQGNSVFFMEQPPLVYLFQSLFFKILGYGMYTERIYSFLTAISNAVVILLIWKMLFRDDQQIKKISWLPVLLWTIIPVCFWSFRNNLMENTMGIFTSLSVFFALRGLTGNKKNIILYLIVAGVFVFLASFSKGIPGLFPVVVPLLWWLVFRNISFSKSLFFSFLIVAVPVIIYSLLLLNDNAYESLNFYLFERAFSRISNEVTTGSHFYILYRLFSELLPDIILCTILFFIFRPNTPGRKYFFRNKMSLLFFLIGASGSFPLMLTMVQKGFYFVPSLAFFATGFAILIAPGISSLISRIDCGKVSFRIFFILSAVLFIFSVSYSAMQKGKISRDSDILNDVYEVGKIVPQYSILDIDQSMFNKWNLQFYLLRYYNISVEPASRSHEYFLTEKNNVVPDTVKYRRIALRTECYDLYKSKK